MIRSFLIAIPLLGITACAYVPMPECEMPGSEILDECSAPSVLGEDDTFAERHVALVSDRQSLSECRLKHKALVELLNSCNDRIDNYNELKK
ncbi:hypothetical protein NMR99_000649 [Vibrio navarrensis]|nr:hypothetical protein [Vibrio navarrensis]